MATKVLVTTKRTRSHFIDELELSEFLKQKFGSPGEVVVVDYDAKYDELRGVMITCTRTETKEEEE